MRFVPIKEEVDQQAILVIHRVRKGLVNEQNRKANQLRSEAHRQRYLNNTYSVINLYENAYLFYKNGILDESAYEGWIGATCNELAKPGIYTMWNSPELVFNDDFRTFVSSSCKLGKHASAK